MKKISIIVLCLFTALYAATPSLGGIAIGDSFDVLAVKYPIYNNWHKLEATTLPYPLNLTNSSMVYLAQSPQSNLHCYLNAEKKVLAVGVHGNVFSTDTTAYETEKGLRATDSVIEIKLLYGIPQDISEYNYKEATGEKCVRRFYYYPSMCIQTLRQDDLPEKIDLILIGNYDMQTVLSQKNKPLLKNGQ